MTKKQRGGTLTIEYEDLDALIDYGLDIVKNQLREGCITGIDVPNGINWELEEASA